MQKTTHFCFAVLALSAAVCTQAARPVEFTVGTEYYKENYREYKDGERLMRQKGNLWSLHQQAVVGIRPLDDVDKLFLDKVEHCGSLF